MNVPFCAGAQKFVTAQVTRELPLHPNAQVRPGICTRTLLAPGETSNEITGEPLGLIEMFETTGKVGTEGGGGGVGARALTVNTPLPICTAALDACAVTV